MRIGVLVPTLALSAGLSAQLTVIPSAAATVRPTLSPFYTSNVFYGTTSTTIAPASRSQAIVDCSDIAAAVAVWNSLEVRRPVGLGNSNPVMTTNATIILSTSSNPSSASTTNFANNHGGSPSTVFSGLVSLPAAANQATWPAPWQTPIPFSIPFVYGTVTGGSLVVDIHQDQTGQVPGNAPWYLEYTTPDVGGRFGNGNAPSTCLFSNNPRTYNSGLSYTTAGLSGNGGNWYVTYNNLKAAVFGVAVIGFQGVGGSWGGVPLPFDLGPAGAPGCSWKTDWMVSVGLVANTSATNPNIGSATWPTQVIPGDLSLRGGSFYDHSLWVDPAANALGLVEGWSSRWGIGTQIGAPGAFVYATGNSAGNATGTRVNAALPTYQLQ